MKLLIKLTLVCNVLALAVEVLKTIGLNELDLCIEADCLLELIVYGLGELLQRLDLVCEDVLCNFNLNFESICVVNTVNNEV